MLLNTEKQAVGWVGGAGARIHGGHKGQKAGPQDKTPKTELLALCQELQSQKLLRQVCGGVRGDWATPISGQGRTHCSRRIRVSALCFLSPAGSVAPP